MTGRDQPVRQQRQLRRLSGSVDAFDDEQLSRVLVGAS